MKPPGFASHLGKRLLDWFDRDGRHDLPWQVDPTPYRVWVSEIMLQQTQVSTVIPFYGRFMARFPSLRSLADGPLDEVLHLWSGLGYYARARNLHRAAQAVVAEHGDSFPEDVAALQALPGIGRSTAGAILALSCGQRHAILDGNVRRVLARCFGVEGWPGERAVESRLWTIAEACTPHQRVGAYTQAIMDLGATVCTRSRPACERCPLREGCVAHASGRQSELPSPRPRRTRRLRHTIMLMLQAPEGAVWLETRPQRGLWGGLHGLPEFDSMEGVKAWLSAAGVAAVEAPEQLAILRHAFTHFDLDILPVRLRLEAVPDRVADSEGLWYNTRQPARVGLAAPVTELLRRLEAQDIP
ncbi:MAG: A/G-specific adenine glycosylase [Steroidobacteraceae bacterium]